MLHVCATPIGNLGDASPRLIETLRAAQVIACEDTRHTLKLLSHFGIKGPRLISLHEHNEERRIGEILDLLGKGAEVALVSDAGTPTLSDPGFRLVRACRQNGLPVRVVPGPSAAMAALSVSGLPSDRVLFVGFLPRSRKELRALLTEISAVRATVVAFESPRRIRPTLERLEELAPDAEVAVCRELSKIHEEVLFGTPGSVLKDMGETVRGEIVLVLRREQAGTASGEQPGVGAEGLPAGTTADEGAVVRAVQQMLQAGMNTRDIAEIVSGMTSMSRREAYSLVLGQKPAKGM